MGGSVMRGVGWVILLASLLLALIVGSFVQWVIPAGVLGFWMGGIIAFLGGGAGIGLIMAGRELRRSGAAKERAALVEAIFELAKTRGGALTPGQVATALSLPAAQADAILTDLAKTTDEVQLEVNDDGELVYLVNTRRLPGKVRISAEGSGASLDSEPVTDEVAQNTRWHRT